MYAEACSRYSAAVLYTFAWGCLTLRCLRRVGWCSAPETTTPSPSGRAVTRDSSMEPEPVKMVDIPTGATRL